MWSKDYIGWLGNIADNEQKPNPPHRNHESSNIINSYSFKLRKNVYFVQDKKGINWTKGKLPDERCIGKQMFKKQTPFLILSLQTQVHMESLCQHSHLTQKLGSNSDLFW